MVSHFFLADTTVSFTYDSTLCAASMNGNNNLACYFDFDSGDSSGSVQANLDLAHGTLTFAVADSTLVDGQCEQISQLISADGDRYGGSRETMLTK